jgi:hypothetical protein
MGVQNWHIERKAPRGFPGNKLVPSRDRPTTNSFKPWQILSLSKVCHIKVFCDRDVVLWPKFVLDKNGFVVECKIIDYK